MYVHKCHNFFPKPSITSKTLPFHVVSFCSLPTLNNRLTHTLTIYFNCPKYMCSVFFILHCRNNIRVLTVSGSYGMHNFLSINPQ